MSSSGAYGSLVVQEIRRTHGSIRFNIFDLKEKIRISMTEHGLHSTAVLQNEYRQTIQSIGRFTMREGYFHSIFAREWQSQLDCFGRAPLITFDIVWKVEELRRFLPEGSPWWKLLDTGMHDLPALIGLPYRRITPAIKSIIDHLIYCPYSESLEEEALDDMLKEYLVLTLSEAANPDWLRKTICKTDLEKIEAARALIETDLELHYHVNEIALKVGLNECKLKILFKRVHGMGMFDYLMYCRCTRVRDILLDSDTPVKALFHLAGYRDMANFVTGFRRHLGITPGSLRR